MKRKTKYPLGIKGIIEKVIRVIKKECPGKKEKISSAWQAAAGEKASEHSMPISIRRKVLTVEVDSSAWLYELTIRKKGILKSIKKDLGDVTVQDIRFRMGDVS